VHIPERQARGCRSNASDDSRRANSPAGEINLPEHERTHARDDSRNEDGDQPQDDRAAKI
jgi:hypothetical protein